MAATAHGTVTDVWDLPYRHSAGRDGSHFLRHLRDHGAVLAKHCSVCRRRTVPPCPCPPMPATAWYPTGPQASLVAGVPLGDGRDWALGLVTLEGADTAVVQRVRVAPGSAPELTAGTSLTVAVAPNRQGRFTDFWFEVKDAYPEAAKRGRTR